MWKLQCQFCNSKFEQISLAFTDILLLIYLFDIFHLILQLRSETWLGRSTRQGRKDCAVLLSLLARQKAERSESTCFVSIPCQPGTCTRLFFPVGILPQTEVRFASTSLSPFVCLCFPSHVHSCASFVSFQVAYGLLIIFVAHFGYPVCEFVSILP